MISHKFIPGYVDTNKLSEEEILNKKQDRNNARTRTKQD